MVEEADVFRQSLAGDGDAFARLVRPHLEVLRRVAFLHARASDIDDVVQDALSKAWLQLGTLRAGTGLRSWLVAIVANHARNHARGAGRRMGWELRAAAISSEDSSGNAPEDAAITRDQAVHVMAAVTSLPDDQRDVVTYRYFLDLSEAEVAEALCIPLGTAKSRLSRAMAKLRRDLAGDHE